MPLTAFASWFPTCLSSPRKHHDCLIGWPEVFRVRLKIQGPEGSKVADHPIAASLSAPSVDYRSTVGVKGRTVILTRWRSLKQFRFSLADHPRLLELVRRVRRLERSAVTFRLGSR